MASPPATTRSAGAPVPAEGPVTDDDRQRFGVLLDRAFDRGLLDAVEYQRRLGALAEAATVEELRDLVTELPVLHGGPDRSATARPRPDGFATLGRPRYGTTATARRSPWPVLVVVLVVLAVLVVVLAVAGAHLARSHRGSAPPPGVPAGLPVAAPPAGVLLEAPTALSPSRP